ncbi:hypothetical protein AVEN_107063-1 [Araneus ventricosus]|uniref:Uncharacterized protein n=1 Tax=Araneus ventricosus TaxID=182803 RepID=A0A4Y2UCB0_ARAVE|nr:hypothetical protein AVEN_107063-1 [Araneus ventricosus]
MGHRTEQVPQREVLVNTPTKRAWSAVWRQRSALVDTMKREEDEGVKRKCEGRERGDFWKSSSEEDRDEGGLDFLGGNKIDLGH